MNEIEIRHTFELLKQDNELVEVRVKGNIPRAVILETLITYSKR